MAFKCSSCTNNKDEREISLVLIEKWGGGVKKYCKDCHRPKAGMADVFFDGKPEINLADDPLTDKPRVFFSKGQKAAYLKSRGIMEAGDRVHGAPVETFKNQIQKPSVDSRDAARKALHHVKQMGQDVRRQEYLRIIKERQRA